METRKPLLSKPKAYSLIAIVLGVMLGGSLLFNVIQATTPSGGPYYLSVPTSSWNFMIDKFSNGSYYMVDATDWRVDYQSTNATKVFNYAIGNLSSGDSSSGLVATAYAGLIFVKDGTYSIDGAITLGRQTRIVGSSMMTVISQTTNNDAFRVAPWIIDASGDYVYSSWEIANLRIDMNQKYGNGIYSLYPTHTGNNWGGSIHDLQIQEVATRYAAINLSRTMLMNIQYVRVDTYGTGVFIDNPSSASLNTGESYLADIFVGVHANGVGFNFSGANAGDNDHVLNAISCTRLEVLADTSETGQYAVFINCAKAIFIRDSVFEYTDFGLYLSNTNTTLFCENIGIYNSRFWAAKDTAVYISSGSRQITMSGGVIYLYAGANYVWRDLTNTGTNNYANRQNVIEDVEFGGQGTIYNSMLVWGTRTEVYSCDFYNATTYYPTMAVPKPFGAFSGNNGIFLAQGTSATPTNTTTYLVFNSAYVINVSGGTGVNCTIDDGTTKVIDNSSTLTAFNIPRGWSFTCTWTTPPAITVWSDSN